MPTAKRYLPYVFLALAVFAVYANIYDNAFLFDDDLLIRLNTYLRGWDTFPKLFTASTTEGAHIAGGFYRPIQNILYFIIFQMGGEQPFGFHLLNVTLHAANACLGYRLALRLGLDPRAALFGMLVWALHPLHTEAITYMSGTADPLFVFFSLWVLNISFPSRLREGLGAGGEVATPRNVPNSEAPRKTIASSPPPSSPASGGGVLAAFSIQKNVWITLPLFALALLSKETAVVLPALACVCLWFVGEQKLKRETYTATWPLWLMAIVYLAWRVNSPDFDGPERYAHLFKLPEYATLGRYAENYDIRVMTLLATLPAYLGLLIWPVDLHMERGFSLYDDPTALLVLGGVTLLGLAATQIFWNRKKDYQALSWGLLWFAAAHAPNTGLLFPMNSLFLEHWMYLPTLGLFLGLAQVAVTALDWHRNFTLTSTALAFTLAVLAALSVATYEQNKIWREPIVFYRNIFDHGAASPRAHNNLAIAYNNIHDLPKAIEEYQRAIHEGDTYAETHYNLALALMSLPDQAAHIQEATKELERSIEIEPRFYRSYLALAKIYALSGQSLKAEMYQQKAKELLAQ